MAIEKSVLEKLKLVPADSVFCIDPNHHGQLLENLPKGVPPYRFVFSFVYSLAQMQEQIQTWDASNQIALNGYLLLMYPKRGNTLGLPAIHRDDIFPFCRVDEASGIVQGTALQFAKMLKYDDNFTLIGLKVIDLRKGINVVSRTESRSENYRERVEELLGLLDDQSADFFKTLSEGYQKDWTRYVFSAKQQQTRDKRLEQVNEALQRACKTIAEYRLRQTG